MNLGNQTNHRYLMLGLALVVIISRILPHSPNFTASIAAIIFGAVVLKSWRAFAAIIIAYLLSDLLINNILYRNNQFIWFSPGILWIVGPLLIVFIANRYFFKKEFSPLGIFGSSLFSSIAFFIISNFGVWISSKITYTHDLNGLIICYFNALPFFAYELAGSLFYSSTFFSVYWLYFYQYYPNESKG